MTTQSNADLVLEVLFKQSKEGKISMSGIDIAEATHLSPTEINAAVKFLENKGLLMTQSLYYTEPYYFYVAIITEEGIKLQEET